MPNVNCKICGQSFYAKPRHLKIGWGKYCSKACQNQGQRTGTHVECGFCGKPVWRSPKQIARALNKKSFCNKSCQTKWRNSLFNGPKHANWKGGAYAYRNMLLKHHTPKACALCEIKDLRVLAVHHIDGNHKNNVLSNLTWLCHNCHILVHHYKEEKEEFERIIKPLPVFRLIMVPMV